MRTLSNPQNVSSILSSLAYSEDFYPLKFK